MSGHQKTYGDELARRFSWTLLLALEVGLLFFAPFFNRPEHDPLPGEATPLMAAESLAYDGDLQFTRADYDRHVLTWLGEPAELALASASAGRHIVYDVAPAYSLWLAPFVRFWPRQGFAVANCLLLLLVSLVVAAQWQRLLGNLGPLALGLCLFTSLWVATPFVADGALFGALATLLAFTLLQRPSGGSRWQVVGWLAGGLLALPVSTAMVHLWLLGAAWFMAPRQRRGPLVGGFLWVMVLLLVTPWWMSGGGLGGEDTYQAQVFSPSQGFPLVDFTMSEWTARAEGASTPVSGASIGDLEVRAWALVDRLFGRSLGVVPFFPLLIPLLWGVCCVRQRRPMVWATLGWWMTSVMFFPADLEMGGMTWAAGRWLPIYAALVASVTVGCSGDALKSWAGLRQGRRWVVWVAAAVVALWTLPSAWQSPWQAPLAWAEKAPRDALNLAQQSWYGFLPFETSQTVYLQGDRLTAAGLTWLNLDGQGWAEKQHQRLVLPSDQSSHWLLVSAEPLAEMSHEATLNRLPDSLGWRLEAPVDSEAGAQRNFAGQRNPVGQGKSAGQHDAVQEVAATLQVESFLPRRHALWWTPEARWLYRVQLTPRWVGEVADDAPPHLVLRPLRSAELSASSADEMNGS